MKKNATQEITISEFPLDEVAILWKWLNDDRKCNFDDFGPRSYTEFYDEMSLRMETEDLFAVCADGSLIGAIGFHPINHHIGALHGICFAKRVHGTQITKKAMGMFLEKIFRSGIHKIQVSYFQDNIRVGRFLEKLGCVVEGLMIANTIQDGKPINMVLGAFFAE